MQLKDFTDEEAKSNKDTVTKFKSIDQVLENVDSKVAEVCSSNHQVLKMIRCSRRKWDNLPGTHR
jgi:uncharacterized protein with GYD domain